MTSRNASFHDRGVAGALLAPLKWLAAIILIFLGLMIAGWIIDWVFVFRVWPEGIARLTSILHVEFARAYVVDGWFGGVPERVAATTNFFYAVVFRATGLHEMGARFAEAGALSIPDTIVRRAYVANYDSLRVAMVGTQLFGVRLAVLSIAIPLFALTYFAAFVDGLAQRAIRRAAGGNESGSIYHRLKQLQLSLSVMAVAAALLWPESFDLRRLVVPTALLLAVLGRWQWAYYKKHL